MATIKLYESRTDVPSGSAQGAMVRPSFTAEDFGGDMGIAKAGKMIAQRVQISTTEAEKARRDKEAAIKELQRQQERDDRQNGEIALAKSRAAFTARIDEFSDFVDFSAAWDEHSKATLDATPESYRPVAQARLLSQKAGFSRTVLGEQARKRGLQRQLNNEEYINANALSIRQNPGSYRDIVSGVDDYVVGQYDRPDQEAERSILKNSILESLTDAYVDERIGRAASEQEIDQVISESSNLPGMTEGIYKRFDTRKTTRVNELKSQELELLRGAKAAISSIQGRMYDPRAVLPPEELAAARAAVMKSGDPDMIQQFGILEYIKSDITKYKSMNLPELASQIQSNSAALTEGGTEPYEIALLEASQKMYAQKKKALEDDLIGSMGDKAPDFAIVKGKIDPLTLSDRFKFGIETAENNGLPFKGFSNAEVSAISEQMDGWSPAQAIEFGTSVQEAARLADPDNSTSLALEALNQFSKEKPMLWYSSALAVTRPEAKADALLIEKGQRAIDNKDALIQEGFISNFNKALQEYMPAFGRISGSAQSVRNAAMAHYVGSGGTTTGAIGVDGADVATAEMEKIHQSLSAVVGSGNRGAAGFAKSGEDRVYLLPHKMTEGDFDDFLEDKENWQKYGNGVPIDKDGGPMDENGLSDYTTPVLVAPDTYQFEIGDHLVMTADGSPFEMKLGGL